MRLQELSQESLVPRLSDMIGTVAKPGRIDPDNTKIVNKKDGIDDLVTCLLAGDFSCVIKNLNWLVNQLFYNNTLKCMLGPDTPDVANGRPDRDVSSGACYTWWGVPNLGAAQACAQFNAIPMAVSTCKTHCATIGDTFESAGCDGSTIWCWCDKP